MLSVLYDLTLQLDDDLEFWKARRRDDESWLLTRHDLSATAYRLCFDRRHAVFTGAAKHDEIPWAIRPNVEVKARSHIMGVDGDLSCLLPPLVPQSTGWTTAMWMTLDDGRWHDATSFDPRCERIDSYSGMRFLLATGEPLARLLETDLGRNDIADIILGLAMWEPLTRAWAARLTGRDDPSVAREAALRAAYPLAPEWSD
jgi:hypothetical protein